MTTRGGWPGEVFARMRRVAASPSSTGIRTSIRMTSGVSSAASSTACAPSPAWPTTSRSGCASSSALNPARTISWSSTTMTLMATSHLPPDRNERLHQITAFRGRSRAHRPVDERHSLSHPDEAVAATGRRYDGVGRPFVLHSHLELVCAVPHRHLHNRVQRVPHRVAQRLLHHPVGSQLNSRIEPGRHLANESHVRTSSPSALDQLGKLFQTRLRLQRTRRRLLDRLPQQPQYPTHLRQREPRCLSNRSELRTDVLRYVGQPVRRTVRADHHDRQVMGDHVMELASDSSPFLQSLTFGSFGPADRLLLGQAAA